MTTDLQQPDEFADLMDLMRNEREYSDRREARDPGDHRRGLRALLITAIVLVLILGGAGGYVAWALNAPLRAPTGTAQEPDVALPPAAALALPAEGASAISMTGADQYVGGAASGIWAKSGGDAPRPIASISKLITALVVLHAKPLKSATDAGPTLTFSKADHALYDKYYVMGAAIAAMPTGSTMSERDALSMLLLPSAANYAEAVANWAFGSQSGYVNATKKWLAANGLTHTTMVEPTGMNARNTSTTADLVALGKLAAANPAVAAITSTKSISLPGPGTQSNTNDLLGTDGITGLKTGNLGDGSYNLLYTASFVVGDTHPVNVTGVVLGGATHQSVDEDVTRLLASIRQGFHNVEVAASGQHIGSYSTAWGSTARIVVAKDASIFTWSNTPITTKLKMKTPSSYANGAVVGSVTFTAGTNTTTVPVTVEGSIHPPTAWWRLTHPQELGG
jgi:D-alanyl-D-alanine carboxypeptidase (penicillin-binding protein 5/6)